MGVGEHLDLDVPATVDIALEEQRAVAEGGGGLSPRPEHGVLEVVDMPDDTHAPPAAARRRLHEEREAHLLAGGEQFGAVEPTDDGVAQHGHVRRPHPVLRRDLGAHRLDRSWRRPDPDETRLGDGTGERRRFGQEAVPGVDGVAAGPPRCVDEEVDPEVRVGRRVAGEPDGQVGFSDEGHVGIGVAVDGDRLDPERAARAHDATGDLASIGDEQATDHAITSGTRRSRCRGGPRPGCRAPPRGTCRARCGCRADR